MSLLSFGRKFGGNFEEKYERKDLYKKKDENKNKICTPLVIDDNPALPPMTKIINKHKDILSLDKELLKIIPKESIFVSYRSPRNIKDIIINSKLHNTEGEQTEKNIKLTYSH